MNVINYSSLQSSIVNLIKGNKSDIGSQVMYILVPQMNNCNYDMYDFTTAVTDFSTGTARITVSDDIKMFVSLEDMLSGGQLDYEGDYKIYVYFDFDNKKFELYFKVLGNWELVETVDFNIADDENKVEQKQKQENDKYVRFSKYINKKTILNEVHTKGEKYFTEAVLSKYLDSQEFNNEFIRTALLNEFKNPSDELITMLATALGKEFTTIPQEKVKEQLEPLTKHGVYDSVKTLVTGEGGAVPTITPSSLSKEDYDFLRTSKKEEKKEEAPKPTQSTQDNSTKQEAKKQTTKPEPKPEKSGSDILRDLGVGIEKKPLAQPKKADEEEEEEVTLSSDGSISLDDLLG